ncbi:hypothetical protein OPQ81_007994 [Rhizoctonia solani]|nr:hypothetical protein OPQ81_007994 [Rhizoctonia solani]
MQLLSRFLSLRRRGHSSKRNKSPQSSGSSFEYGQPEVHRLSGDFDPHEYRPHAANRSDFDLSRSAGIPIRVTTPRSFPLPKHAIDHVPRRDPNELASPRLVKIHRKKLLQRTEFPHADPPRSPRKVSQAEFSRSEYGHKGRNRSVRRIESVYSDWSKDLTFESSRLENLRQDPSVLSLISIMDSQGFILPDAFTNGAETPKTIHKYRIPGYYAGFSKSTPELSVRTHRNLQFGPPPPQTPNPSANDAVTESSLISRQIPTSGVSGIPFAHGTEGQQTLSTRNATHNLPANAEPVCFPFAGTSIINGPSGSHISHSRIISPLGSPLPVLTRIQPYSSSFSRSGFGINQRESTLEEMAAPSPSRSLWESSCYSPPTVEMSPRTPKTAELIQGLPAHNGIPTPNIAVSPSQTSACDYYPDKKLSFCSPAGRDADFADRKVIRRTRSLHRTPGTLDMRGYGCHVPTQSVYMQSPTQEDQHTRVIHMTRSTVIEEGRAGTGNYFDFNSDDNIVNSDSVGDCPNNDHQEITPGRPTVVLVPSGKQLDHVEGPSSASAPASVTPELDREQSGPLFALGLDPRFQQEAASQSAISCADSFYTAREEFTIGDHPSWTNEFGVRTRFTRNGNDQSRQMSQAKAPKLNLDLSRSPLVATCGPVTSVSSSHSQDPSHHGTQYIV